MAFARWCRCALLNMQTHRANVAILVWTGFSLDCPAFWRLWRGAEGAALMLLLQPLNGRDPTQGASDIPGDGAQKRAGSNQAAL